MSSRKVWKRVKPPLADRDPTSTVELEVLPAGLRASGDHAKPGIVFWGSAQSVLRVAGSELFSVKASARLGVAVAKFFAVDKDRFAAVTLAEPAGTARLGYLVKLERQQADRNDFQ